MAKYKTIAVDYFSRSNGDGRLKNGAIENESVEFAVFAARVGVGGKVAEEGFVEFATGETRIENFGVDASGDGAEMLLVKKANQFTGIAFPDGEEGGHADAGEVFLAIDAKVFEENVAEGDSAYALVVEETESFFHARFVDRVDALLRNENFVKRLAQRI